MRTDTLKMEIDCHAHAFDGEDDYLTLVGVAETYGILIRELPDHAWAGWAWWYEIEGPIDHLRRFLVEEYCGCDAQADEMISGWQRD